MMKRLLSVAIIGAMLCSLFVAPVSAKTFPDATGHWAQSAIETWSERGVVNGDDAGNFRPGDSITRAETAKLIDNLIGFQKTSNKVFSDVPTDAWYASSINKLYAAQVMTGYEDGTIRPGNSISRQEAAVIIARAFALDTKKVDTGILANFADNDQIQDWAKSIVAYMAGLAFVQGSDGVFRPNDPITRAEVVTILNNMVGVYADGSQSTYTGNFGDKIAIIKAPVIFNGVTMGGAVVCGTTKGKVNFNSGSKISGCVCNWAPNASVSTAGATVAATANKGGGTISAGGNFNAMTGGAAGGGSMGGGSMGGGSMGGGSVGGSTGNSSSNQISITFHGNGGVWDGGRSQQTVYYTGGNSYALRLPTNPLRTGYSFEGWYSTQIGANALISTQKLNPHDIVSSTGPKTFYAGWRNPNGLYGVVSVATDADMTGRGKTAADLMDGVALVSTPTADTYQATGGLRYVTGSWAGSPTLDPEGNFLALTYTLPTGIDATNVKLSSKFSDGSNVVTASSSTFLNGNRTYTRVFKITSSDLAKDILFMVDLAGDNRDVGIITIDLANLVCRQFVTVTTPEEFIAAANNPAAEKITIDAPITLTSGTYGSATRKALVVNAPISIAKDATVTLKNFNVTVAATVPVLFANTTEIPAGGGFVGGSGGGGSASEVSLLSTAVATKAAALTLEGISLSGAGILNGLLVKDLVIKNTAFTYAGDSTATAISLAAPAEGDTVSITYTTLNGYDVALETQDAALFNEEENTFLNNIFKNNITDLKLGATAAALVLSYNYFDEIPVVTDPEGAVTNLVGPLYTAEAMQGSDLPENPHDAYVYVDGVYKGKLSEISTVELTFETEEATPEIQLVPTDARDTIVTIGETQGTVVALAKDDLPKELTIVIGDGNAKVITVSEAVATE